MIIFAPAVQRLLHSKKLEGSTVKKNFPKPTDEAKDDSSLFPHHTGPLSNTSIKGLFDSLGSYTFV